MILDGPRTLAKNLFPILKTNPPVYPPEMKIFNLNFWATMYIGFSMYVVYKCIHIYFGAGYLLNPPTMSLNLRSRIAGAKQNCQKKGPTHIRQLWCIYAVKNCIHILQPPLSMWSLEKSAISHKHHPFLQSELGGGKTYMMELMSTMCWSKSPGSMLRRKAKRKPKGHVRPCRPACR